MAKRSSDDYCVHGTWQDGVCVCEPGYRTRFVDTELTPQYCAESANRVMKNPAYNAANLLRLSAMVVSYYGLIIYIALRM